MEPDVGGRRRAHAIVWRNLGGIRVFSKHTLLRMLQQFAVAFH